MAVATANPDPTTRSLGMFNDPSRWRLPDGKTSTIVTGVPVFDEHVEKDERRTVTDTAGKEVANPNYGKVVRNFDAARLQMIADNCNRRFQTTGDACPVTLGHTRPGEPESHQPDICGYAINFRLGRYGPSKRLAILADFYILPAYWGEFLKHPRRSVELFPRDQVFDPIAVLKRTPERDLGIITDYTGTDGATMTPAIQHAAAARQAMRYQRARDLSGEPIRYSISDSGEAMPDNMTPPPGDEKQAAEEFAKKVIAAVPHMRARAKKYEAETGEKVGGDGEVSLKDQYQARRFYKGYYLKNSAKIRNAKKRYEAEANAEKDDEADHFAAEDELAPAEEAQAESYYRHFSKHKGIRYAMGLDDEAKSEEPPAAPAAAAPGESETPPPAAPAAPAAAESPASPAPAPAPAAPEMSSMAEHKVQPPEQALDDKHGFTEEQYFRHRYHKDATFKHMYDRAHNEVEALKTMGGQPPAPAAAPPAAPAQYSGAPAPAAGAPSATNVTIPPGPAEQHAKRDTAVVPASGLGGDAIHYARQLQDLTSRVTAVEADNAKLRQERDTSRGELYVVALEGEGFNFGGRRAQKVEQFAKLGDEGKRQALAQEIRETWKTDGPPVNAQPIHLGIYADPQAVAHAASRGEAERFSKEDALAATTLAQSDPEFTSDPEGSYSRAVQKIKADRANKVRTA